MTEAQKFNRISFITLNQTRLFTVNQVADLIEEYSSAKSTGKVLDATPAEFLSTLIDTAMLQEGL